MPWDLKDNRIAAVKYMHPKIQRKATLIANAIMREGNADEGQAIAIGIKKAKEMFEKCLAIKDDFKEARYDLGLTYMLLKEYKNAKEIFEKSLKIAPKDINIIFNLAMSLQMMESYDEAKVNYEKILKDQPEYFKAHLNLGIISFKQGNYETAVKILTKANEIEPENAQVLFYIARCKDELCQYDSEKESMGIIMEYAKLGSRSDLPEEFHTVLARAYAKSGNLEDTLRVCQAALVLNDEDIEAYTLLGLIQLIKKDMSGVKDTLTTALDLQSKNKEVHNLMSYVLCQQDNRCKLKKCREKYKELIKNYIENTETKNENQ